MIQTPIPESFGTSMLCNLTNWTCPPAAAPSMSGRHDRSPLADLTRLVIIVLLVVVIIFTIGGNLLTIVVMRFDKRLRSQHVSSMYIASLAAADLLVGSVVMTIMLLYTVVFDGRWVFGSTVCTAWTCIDYISCTASLTNVFLIAVDRYRSVSQPLKTIPGRTKRRASLYLAIAWLTPAVFWTSVICLVKSKPDDPTLYSSSTDDFICDTHWDPPEVAIASVVVMFYAPLFAIFILFGLIMCVLQKHKSAMTARMRNTLSLGCESSDDQQRARNETGSGTTSETNNYVARVHSMVITSDRRISATDIRRRQSTATIGNGNGCAKPEVLIHAASTSCRHFQARIQYSFKDQSDKKSYTSKLISSDVQNSCAGENTSSSGGENAIRLVDLKFDAGMRLANSKLDGSSRLADPKFDDMTSPNNEAVRWTRNMHFETQPRWNRYASQLRAQRHDSLQEVRLRQQIKAARILGAITGFLMLCWVPFSVMLAIKTYCPDCLTQRTFDIAIWINYINSGINPIIYCLCNSQYRLALKKLMRKLRCCKRASNNY